ncbi:MAG: lysylphosphatidylglycerol synthase domain-containing protein [Nitrospinales bacterium]
MEVFLPTHSKTFDRIGLNRDTQPMPAKKRMAMRILAVIALMAAFGFIGRVCYKNWERLENLTVHFDLAFVALSVFLLSAAIFSAGWGWFIILRSVGINAPYRLVQYNWFLSNLGKYIPGKIWTISSRVYLHSAHNHSAKQVVSASLLEAIFSYTVAVLVVLILAVYLGKLNVYLGPLALIFFLGCLFLSPRLFSKALNLGLSLIKKGDIQITLDIVSRLKIAFVYLGAFIFWGLAFSFFVKSLFPVAPSEFAYFTLSFVFSSLAGMLAFFVPKGVGVRESMLVLMLSPVIGEPAALVAAISSRLWIVLTEAFLMFLSYLAFKPKAGKAPALEKETA